MSPDEFDHRGFFFNFHFMQKIAPLLLLIFLFCAQRSNATNMYFSGTVGVNDVWSVDTVFVTGDVYVSVGRKLTIQPGTVVRFMGYYMFYHSGSIQALGAANDSIRFEAYDSTGCYDNTTNNGGWKGMQIQSLNVWTGSDSTIFEYCSFQDMKEGPSWNNAGLMFWYSSRARISHSVFRYNYYPHFYGPLFCRDTSAIIVSYCSFHNNVAGTGGGITAHDFSNVKISWSKFYNNYVEYSGGGIQIRNSSATIINNIICNNTTKISNCGPADGGGGIRCIYDGYSYIANNVIANNFSGIHAGGIEFMYGANALLEHNDIVNNSAQGNGAGLCILESNVTVKNNIITGNRSYTTLNYEIWISGNQTSPAMTGDIYHNLIEGDTNYPVIMISPLTNFSGSVASNFDSLPQFISPSLGAGPSYNGMVADWRLNANSACINFGSGGVDPLMPSLDLYGNPRLSGWQYDVGAYEATMPDNVIESHSNAFFAYPNPTSGNLNLSIPEIAGDELVRIHIYNVAGLLIASMTQPLSAPVSIEGDAGCYFIEVVAENLSYHTSVLIQ